MPLVGVTLDVGEPIEECRLNWRIRRNAMRARARIFFAVSLLAFGVACSTTEISMVEMKAFTTAMDTNLDVVEKRLHSLELEEMERNERFNQITEIGGFFTLVGECASKPSPLTTDLKTLENATFGDSCKLVATTARGEHPDFKPSQELDNAIATKRMAGTLRKYVEAISELSDPDAPSQVAQKLGKSLMTLTTLTETDVEVATQKDFKFSDDVSRTINTSKTLAETLAQEGLGAMRYRALAAIVADSDPSVTAACIQLALWLAEKDAATLPDDLKALQQEEENARRRAEELVNSNIADDATLVELVRKTQALYDKIAKTDKGAEWRVFLSAAYAHRALKEALENPVDIEFAVRAQTRLQVLVERTIAFVEAAENL